MPLKEQVQHNCDCLIRLLRDPSLQELSGLAGFLNETSEIKKLADGDTVRADAEFHGLIRHLSQLPDCSGGVVWNAKRYREYFEGTDLDQPKDSESDKF